MKINNGIDSQLNKYVKSPSNKPNKIIVHHTGGTDKNILEDTSHHSFESVKAFHKSKGWDTIGYHFLIEKDGDIWQGRPVEMHGAHCTGQNNQSIGVCMSGNFDLSMPSDSQISSLRGLLIELMNKYQITEIVPHRKFANKTCYGNNLSDTWASDLVKKSSLEGVSNDELLQELKKRLK